MQGILIVYASLSCHLQCLFLVVSTLISLQEEIQTDVYAVKEKGADESWNKLRYYNKAQCELTEDLHHPDTVLWSTSQAQGSLSLSTS